MWARTYGMRRADITTFRRDFAADLLQVQQREKPDALSDCIRAMPAGRLRLTHEPQPLTLRSIRSSTWPIEMSRMSRS
jgi:hypothetical protein